MSLDAALDLSQALARIADAALARDRDAGGLEAEMGCLHAAGNLVGALPAALTGTASWSDDPLAIAGRLRDVGRASLPVGRLFEGHVNAAQMIGLYGEPSLQRATLRAVTGGALLGVWGANGQPPVRAERLADGGFRLSGTKIFCSGLGLVRHALVSATLEERTALFAVDVGDTKRMDEDQWDVSGMRATRSGGYDFEGVILPPDALVGALDVYFLEPHFLGGMYRFCAVQVGGLEALLDEMILAIRRRGHAQNPLAQYRVGAVAASTTTAAAATIELARGVADARDPEDIARKAVLTREGVERCIVQALELVERGLGTEVHRERTRLSMLRRDLSFYIRQAAVDERLSAVGRSMLER